VITQLLAETLDHVFCLPATEGNDSKIIAQRNDLGEFGLPE
jgi:hypothetical protein